MPKPEIYKKPVLGVTEREAHYWDRAVKTATSRMLELALAKYPKANMEDFKALQKTVWDELLVQKWPSA